MFRTILLLAFLAIVSCDDDLESLVASIFPEDAKEEVVEGAKLQSTKNPDDDLHFEVIAEVVVPDSHNNQYISRGCGYRNPDGVGFRITDDTNSETAFGEFPWMVEIFQIQTDAIYGNELYIYHCGGALIHPKVVLTAGHCVVDATKDFKVRAGEWDTQIKTEVFRHQDADVEKVIVHPHFHAGSSINDVALLILKTPVVLEDHVDKVCLPPKDVVFDQKQCFVTGWGKDASGKYQAILKKAELSIVANPKCQEALRKTHLGVNFELHKSFICAGGEAVKNICKGDDGSPLVCPIPGKPGRYYQAGIVAWGIGCGENNTPGVYANVGHQRAWIDEQMEHEKLDKKEYIA